MDNYMDLSKIIIIEECECGTTRADEKFKKLYINSVKTNDALRKENGNLKDILRSEKEKREDLLNRIEELKKSNSHEKAWSKITRSAAIDSDRTSSKKIEGLMNRIKELEQERGAANRWLEVLPNADRLIPRKGQKDDKKRADDQFFENHAMLAKELLDMEKYCNYLQEMNGVYIYFINSQYISASGMSVLNLRLSRITGKYQGSKS